MPVRGYGTGSNGKSTLFEVILHILGDYGIDLPFSNLEVKRYGGSNPGEGVNLPGARFAKVVETREDCQLDEARVKSWTGGDTMSIRPMYTNSISFIPSHKLWLAFNHKPVVSDDSHAMWRRIKLIPFLRTFKSSQVDKNLLKKLKAEGPGILNWMIAGCLAWQKEGLTIPPAVEQATREYQAESDIFGQFLEDTCEMGASFREPKGDLWDAYKVWCRRNKQRVVSPKIFAEKMTTRGYGELRHAQTRYWTGLRLLPPVERMDSSMTPVT
jgi:putative DNA primase/helicase